MKPIAIFSVAPYDPNVGKGYYKDFAPASVDTLQELGKMMYTHSLSGYLYGEELTKTNSGCYVHYRKAKDNIVGIGNIIFIDIDNKNPLDKSKKAEGDDFVSLDELRTALKSLGAPAVITHSKSSRPEHPKFHVSVITTGNGEADNFKEHYNGFAEKLGIRIDMSMSRHTQNLTPAYLHPERFIEVIEGHPLPFTSLMPSEAFIASLPSNGRGLNGTHGITVANYDDLTIRRQNEGDFIEQWELPSIVFEAEKKGAENGKIRTQCHHGKAHDGRYDAGFIRFEENRTAIYSHCSACGDKIELWRYDYADEFDNLGELIDSKKSFKGEPISLSMLYELGIAIDYNASDLTPLDDEKILFDRGLHLFYAPAGSFKSYSVATLAFKTGKDVYYFDFEYNPSGLKKHCESLGVHYVSPPNNSDELKILLKSELDCGNALLIFDSFSNLIAEDSSNNDATDTANIVKLMREMTRNMGATIIFIDHATRTDYKTSHDKPKPWEFKLEGNESGKKKPCDLVYKLSPVDPEDYTRGVNLKVEKTRSTDRCIGETIKVNEEIEAWEDMFHETQIPA